MHLGVTGLLDYLPDMVISGINAALTWATTPSIPAPWPRRPRASCSDSVGRDLAGIEDRRISTAAQVAVELVEWRARARGRGSRTFNVPDIRYRLQGIVVTRLGRRHRRRDVIPAESARRNGVLGRRRGRRCGRGEGTDFHAVDNRVS